MRRHVGATGHASRGVRAVALLYWLYVAATLPALVVVPYLLWTSPELENRGVLVITLALTLPLVLVLPGAAAWHLQRLNNVGQVLGAIVAGFSLFAFPLGTVVGAVVLWTLLGERGRFVFSKAYHEARAATPHLEFRISKLVIWLAVAFLVVDAAVWFVVVPIAMRRGSESTESIAVERDADSVTPESENETPPLPTWEQQLATIYFFDDSKLHRLAGVDEDLIEHWKEPIDPLGAGPFKRQCTILNAADPDTLPQREKCSSRSFACTRMARACVQDGLCALKRLRCVDMVFRDPKCCQ